RTAGLNIAIGPSGKKIGDQFKIADKKGIQNALVIGEDELKTGKYALKNLKTGKETKGSLAEIAKLISKDK
ncbi:MAG TPA: His/Gly/Thr/Pro-type tRNA ligase C-terminal domain-containing protein, partial [Methylomirabilota bacterium]|nr:His/Gly/Thr/Pro-type tRNA ligase C-terminal domain-containing protein [Methylomirabilota bacterium]